MIRGKPGINPLSRSTILGRKSRERPQNFCCPLCRRHFRTDEAYKAHYKQEHAK